MNEITYEESRALENPLYLDVRAPIEYSNDHIPGALNMPLFDDEERHEIGKIYKALGQSEAIVRGSEIVGGKIGDIVSNIRNIKEKQIIIYCFRGGMRSSSITSLLTSLQFHVFKLKNGYKAYRKHVRDELDRLSIKSGIYVLHGLTGTGKTEIIKYIDNSVDLEKYAGHRSSVFGGIGLKQKTQKMFESLLLKKITDLRSAEYIVLEGESRKIGDLHIPNNLLEKMHSSPGIRIEASIERRINILLKEYDSYNLEPEKIIPIINSISGRLGKKNVAALIELFEKGDMYEFTELLLEKYYDPLYRHSLEKMEFIARIENVDSEEAAAEVERIIKN